MINVLISIFIFIIHFKNLKFQLVDRILFFLILYYSLNKERMTIYIENVKRKFQLNLGFFIACLHLKNGYFK
jgi:hypothetical protein